MSAHPRFRSFFENDQSVVGKSLSNLHQPVHLVGCPALFDLWSQLDQRVSGLKSLGVFALGVEGGVTVTIDTSTLPTNSGTIAGAGIFAEGSAVTLTATPSPGYAFSNWTENGVVIIASPSPILSSSEPKMLRSRLTIRSTSRRR